MAVRRATAQAAEEVQPSTNPANPNTNFKSLQPRDNFMY